MFAISFIGLAPPLWEWILAILYINFFTFAAFDNPYYESVHQINKDPKPEPEVETTQIGCQ